MLSERELDVLMARLADGDRTAFDPLFRALYPRAQRVARTRLDASSAEDAAQAALLRVFARASEFEAGRAVLPWFYAVVANEVRAIRRRGSNAADATAVEASLADPSTEDPETELVRRELHTALERAIETLDAPAAEAIAAVLGHRAPPEIAAAAFRKRVSRAYARLRLLLGGTHGE